MEKHDWQKRINYIWLPLLISNTIFVLWYFGVAYNVRFTVDDYWHGYKLHYDGLIHMLIYHYLNLEGSLSHVLLATVPHIFLSNQSYSWIFCAITFLSLTLSINMLIFKLVDLNSSSLRLLLALLIVNVFFLTLSSKSELLFCLWLNFSYTFGISHFIFGTACIDNYKKISIALLSFFALNKINLAFDGLVLLTILFYYTKTLKNNYWIIIIYASFLFLNVAAVGNIHRREEILNTTKFILDFNIIKENFVYYSLNLFSKIPFLVSSLGMCFFYVGLNTNNSKNNNSLSRLALFLISPLLLFLIFDSIFFSIAFGNSGPPRTRIFTEFYLMVIICGLFMKFGELSKSILFKYRNQFYLLLIFSLFLLIFHNLSYFRFIPIASKYAHSVDARELIVKNASANGQKDLLRLAPLSDAGIINNVWSEDTLWLNNVYVKYYNLKCNIEINRPLIKSDD